MKRKINKNNDDENKQIQLRKCLIWSKDFTSDPQQSIDLVKIDLSKLLEEQEFNVHSQVAYNWSQFSHDHLSWYSPLPGPALPCWPATDADK